MSRSIKKLMGILLLFLGAWVFLGKGDVGGFFTFLIGLALIVYGVKKLKQPETEEKKWMGIIALIIGGSLLINWVSFLISLLIGLACIYFGWKLIKRNGDLTNWKLSVDPEAKTESKVEHFIIQAGSIFESEWKEFLKNYKKLDEK